MTSDRADNAGAVDVPPRIVVTGAGGFVGRRVVERLQAQGAAVTGIGRSAQPADWPADARWLRADVSNTGDYEKALIGADCVLHLAALTGKARPEDFQRANVDATRILLNACARANVGRFVFVSSIAVTFADRRYYAYAESKIAAEALVRAAQTPSVIVRPTMILGPGSAIEASLSRLARLPIAPTFGDGRGIVQPVDVDDVADLLTALALGAGAAGETIELGGPDRYDLRTLYARLRGATRPPPMLHLPLGLARWGLALVEKPLLALLPLTAGQLASFANDGVAQPHPLVARTLPLQRSAPRKPEPRPLPTPTPTDRATLEQEAKRFIPYVAGVKPSEYQIGKYVEFHAQRGIGAAHGFDAWLAKWARTSGFSLALADAYSGLLFRTAAIRQKLVLALGIAESSGASALKLDRSTGSWLGAFFSAALHGIAAALMFALALVVLLPAHILLGRRSAVS